MTFEKSWSFDRLEGALTMCFWALTDRHNYFQANQIHILLLHIAFGINWGLHVAATVAFLVAAFCPPRKVKLEILICNIYMWFNLCYPGLVIYFLYLVAGTFTYDACYSNLSYWLYMVFIFGLTMTWVFFNGIVAMGYRNTVKRSNSTGLEQGMIQPPPVSTVDETAEGMNGVTPEVDGNVTHQRSA